MYFHLEERQAWIRTQSHTVVFDRDPEYASFVHDQRGIIQRIVRVWVAEPAHDIPYKREYLGALMLWANRASIAEVNRMFRKASVYASCSKESPKEFRRRLMSTLRQYIRSK